MKQSVEKQHLKNKKKNITCPITQEIFLEPVVTECGHSFEKEAIEEWLKKHESCPECNAKIKSKHHNSSFTIKSIVEERLEEFPDWKFKQYKFNEKLTKLIEENQFANVMLLFINKKFPINGPLFNDNTALHIAAINDHKLMVAALLAIKGVNVNALNQDKRTPLRHALGSNKTSIETLQLLIEAGAALNKPSFNGNTPLIAAIQHNKKGAQFLINNYSADLDFNHKNNSRESALYIAAKNGEQGIVAKLLQQKDIDLDAIYESKNGKQTTAYQIASKKGHFKTAALFSTPGVLFKFACLRIKQTRFEEAVEYLFEIYTQSKPNKFQNLLNTIENDFNDSYLEVYTSLLPKILDSAIDTNNFELIKRLSNEIEYPNEEIIQSFYAAIKSTFYQENNEPLRKLLSLNNADIIINALDKNKNVTLLFYATTIPEIDPHKIKLLLAAGANPNLANDLDELPLFNALQSKVFNIAKILIDSKKIDFNNFSKSGHSFITHFAHYEKKEEIAGLQFLLQHTSIDINDKNNNGVNALHIVVANGDLAKTLLLLSTPKIDIEIPREEDAKTSLEIAYKSKNSQIISVFKYIKLTQAFLDNPFSDSVDVDHIEPLTDESLHAIKIYFSNLGYNQDQIDHVMTNNFKDSQKLKSQNHSNFTSFKKQWSVFFKKNNDQKTDNKTPLKIEYQF